MAESASALRIYPIFRSSFELTDRDAYAKAVTIVRDWITSKCGPGFHLGQGDHVPFESCEARGTIREVPHEDGRIFAARLEDLREAGSGRTWVTDLFVESREKVLVRFGAELRLTAAQSAGERFSHSRPRVVRDILSALSAEADGVALTEAAETVTLEDFPAFLELLTRQRRLPVVAISRDEAGALAIDAGSIARDLAGGAHLRILEAEASWELTRRLGKSWSVYNRATRLYLPGVSEDDDPFRHPLLLFSPSRGEKAHRAWLAERVLPFGFRDRDQDARFWRIGLLQRLAHPAQAGTAEEVEMLKAQLAELSRDKQSAESLMEEANAAKEKAEAEASRLQNELDQLRASLAALPSAAPAQGASAADVAPLIRGALTVPAALRLVERLFPDRLVVLASAHSAAAQSVHFHLPERALDLLWKLATTYWAELAGGRGDVEAHKVFGKAYAPKETQVLSKRGRSLRTFRWNGTDIFMERHLKIGVKDSAAETLRIHFHWDGDRNQIIIGHCGPHLDF
ncbi:hypothetical protein [Thermaurantiacus sp.]